MSSRRYYLALLILLGLMITSRFAQLGAWSFASDELGTFLELDTYRDPENTQLAGPDVNVPRMIPLAMELYDFGRKTFGDNERGCRTISALFSILQFLALAIGLPGIIGRSATLCTLLLLTVWPEQLFYAQYHRYYTATAFFVTCSLLAAARGTALGMLLSLPFTAAAILTHTLSGAIVGGVLLSAFLQRKQSYWALSIAIIQAIAAGLFFYFYLLPLSKDKALNYEWQGFGLVQSLQSGLSQITLVVALLAFRAIIFGETLKLSFGRFWTVLCAVWLGMLLVLPMTIPFHTAYLFPMAIGLVVISGTSLSDMVKQLEVRRRGAGVSLAILLALLNLPIIFSHFQDGTRHDFRTAANWLADHLSPQDHLGTIQGDKIDYYQPHLAKQRSLLNAADIPGWVNRHRPQSGRLWVMVPGGRNGLPDPWQQWLYSKGRLRHIVQHPRYDYLRFPIYIWEVVE